MTKQWQLQIPSVSLVFSFCLPLLSSLPLSLLFDFHYFPQSLPCKHIPSPSLSPAFTWLAWTEMVSLSAAAGFWPQQDVCGLTASLQSPCMDKDIFTIFPGLLYPCVSEAFSYIFLGLGVKEEESNFCSAFLSPPPACFPSPVLFSLHGRLSARLNRCCICEGWQLNSTGRERERVRGRKNVWEGPSARSGRRDRARAERREEKVVEGSEGRREQRVCASRERGRSVYW